MAKPDTRDLRISEINPENNLFLIAFKKIIDLISLDIIKTLKIF
jgi:hypothetical protein